MNMFECTCVCVCAHECVDVCGCVCVGVCSCMYVCVHVCTKLMRVHVLSAGICVVNARMKHESKYKVHISCHGAVVSALDFGLEGRGFKSLKVIGIFQTLARSYPE